MIIRIEDAPAIKHITIDINFEDGTSTATSVSNGPRVGGNTYGTSDNIDHKMKTKSSIKGKGQTIPGTDEKVYDEVPLDLDETFAVNTEVVAKPIIPDIEREVNISNDMINAQF